jgi:hypothetical protein
MSTSHAGVPLMRSGVFLNITLTTDQGHGNCDISIGSDAARSEAAFGALLEW